MDLSKSREYFNPHDVNKRCHIIGCGSIGSTLAVMLAKMGMSKFALYDFDKVEEHNIVNQMFSTKDVKTYKVDALKKIIEDINPNADITIYKDGWVPGRKLSGYVFLAVDKIATRKQICEENLTNNSIKIVMDFRTELESAQHYAADWSNMTSKKKLIATMDFTDQEASDATPKSACGVTLGVFPTVASICSLGVSNFINWIRKDKLEEFVMMSPFYFNIINE